MSERNFEQVISPAETKQKSLVINAAVCDMTKMNEETAASYRSVTVNAAAVLVNPEIRRLMSKYAISLNTASVIDVPDGCAVAVKNGCYEITPGKVKGKTALIVNGTLTIRPNSEEALSSYAHITVNGSVLAPKSMAGELSALNVNGSCDYYPDEAILIDGKLKMDKTFILRAKQGSLYYADGKVLILEAGLDLDSLVKKDVRIKTGSRIIAYESYMEQVIKLFDEDAKLLFIPDGSAYINDDCELGDRLLRRFGSSLYINGDLTVPAGSRQALEKIEYLGVNGDVLLSEELEELFFEKCKLYSEVKPLPKGVTVSDKPILKVDAAMLQQCEEGLNIRNCAAVKFAGDVTPELIEKYLISIEDCAFVSCPEGLQSAIELVAKDVAQIGSEGSDSLLGGLGSMFGKSKKENEDTVVINAAMYTL
jgi:hypothetical protein